MAAGAGLRVAKHGNRSVSSRCGSADVLEALGVDLSLPPERVGRCIEEVGIGFLFAPLLHSAMKHVLGPRREIGQRTIFNILGPLTNPARADVQVLGVYRPELTETLARVLGRLGCRSGFVVHGLDGCDEISISGPSRLTRVQGERTTTFELSPEEAGLSRAAPGAVRGGDAARNAALTRAVLSGENGPCRDMVLLNAAAVFVAAGLAPDFRDGAALAAQTIDSGRALAKLEALIAVGREPAPRGRARGRTSGAVGTVLDRIMAVKAEEVARLKGSGAAAEIRARAEATAKAADPGRDFLGALGKSPGRTIIAEIKKASPSAGPFPLAGPVEERARAYGRGGAAALSVLTDRRFFGGGLEDLVQAHRAVDLPILRKDFILDPVQVQEARAAGADAVLLIAAALEPVLLAELHALALELGLTPLIEVHHESELDPVLALGPALVGINNRDLKTLKTSLDNFARVRRLIPKETLVVAESGISSPADLDRLEAEGADAFLIGTGLMRAPDPAAELRLLLGQGARP